MRLFRFFWSAAAVAPILLAAGCGTSSGESPDPAVRGKVVLKGSTATPRLEGGKVWFRSVSDPGRESVGVIDHDGTFVMATVAPGGEVREGVPPGEYAVRITPPADDRGVPFHDKYADYQKSGLRVHVPPTADLTFELDRPGR